MPGDVRSGNGDVAGGARSVRPRCVRQVSMSPSTSRRVSSGAEVQETSLRSAKVEK